MRIRSRALYAAIAVATIGAGLATRRNPDWFPAPIAEYGGDVLWAMMMFWIVAIIWRSWPTIRIATVAIAISIAVELSQLYRAEWIETIRAGRAGALVLGSGFLWSDLVCYGLGVGLAAAFDYLRTRGASFP
jgi:hypothetical protein